MKLYGTEDQRVELTHAQATALLESWLGAGVTCRGIEPMEGGVCSEVFRLRFDRPPHWAVVKLLPGDGEAFRRERRCLDYLRRHTSLPCPEVYAQDGSRTIIPFSFLLLECMPGMNLESAYPSAAGILTWRREFEFRRGGGARAILRDSFVMSSGVADIRVPFFCQAKTTLLAPGRIRIATESKALVMEYPAAILRAGIQAVPLSDSKLRSVWGSELHKIELRYVGGKSADSYELVFRPD